MYKFSHFFPKVKIKTSEISTFLSGHEICIKNLCKQQGRTMKTSKNYKQSIYNYWYKSTDGKVNLLYNTYTGALAFVQNCDLSDVSNLLENPNNLTLRTNRDDLFSKMFECGFVVEDNVNEIEFVKFRAFRGAFERRNLSITMLPTRACNFRCIYCFESEINETITIQDCNNVLKFINSEIQRVKPEGISISWYGGEPLLAYDRIKQLSSELINIASANKIRYEANIVTNGYLLTEEIARELINSNVKLIQITLDGPEEVHNRRRPLKNRKPTFGRIKEAIIIAKKYFDHVDIRLNIDRDNANAVLEFLRKTDWLYGKNTVVRPGKLRDYTQKCADFAPQEKGFSAHEYNAIYEAIRKITSDKEEDIDTVFPNALPVRSFYCGAQVFGTYTVGPNSRVYKCTSHLDIGDEVGYIKEGKFIPNQQYINYFFEKHPCDTEPCKSCKLLPLCMGGCQVIRKKCKTESELKSAICDHFWGLLNKYLEKTALDKGQVMKGGD